MIRAYTQFLATLNLIRAFATGGNAAMQRVNQWNLDFTEQSEQGDRYYESAHRVDEAIGLMAAAGLKVGHPVTTTVGFWTKNWQHHRGRPDSEARWEDPIVRLDGSMSNPCGSSWTRS